MDIGIRFACRQGEYYDSVTGCRFCSWVQNPYQEILCPCEASRDAVVGCKVISSGSNLCRQRSAALEECARRGFTSNVVLHTTSSAGSTTSVANASSATFTIEASQLRSMRATSMHVIGIPPSTASPDEISLLSNGLSIGVTILILVILVGALFLLLFLLRRKAFLNEPRIVLDGMTGRALRRYIWRPRAPATVDQTEAKESTKKLILVDSVCNPTPQVIVYKEAAPLGNQKPSSVINNYHVTVKNSQFTQVGSHNVLSVGERVASAIGSVDELSSKDDEQDSCTGGLDISGDSSLSRSTSRDAAFSYCLYEQPEVVFHQPLRDDIVYRREEGNACPCNGQKRDTSEMSSGDRTSRDLSAGRPGEEQHKSSHASSGPAGADTTSHSSSVTGLSVHSEESSISRYRGNENVTADSSHLPTQITDFYSQAISASAKASPASFPAQITDSSTVAEPLCSQPGDKECRSPSVSGQSACGAVVPLKQTSPSLTSSRHVSMDSGGGSERLSVRPPAPQPVSAEKTAMLGSLSELLTG